MQVVLLGAAAGGGFPQWNCRCRCCRAARLDPRQAISRTQSAAAVSADGVRWFLLNASPDVRAQLERLTPPDGDDLRHSPVAGVVLTDAELDHTIGLPLLRESRQLGVYATGAVQTVLEYDSRLLPVTRAFADVHVTDLTIGRCVSLRDFDGRPSGLVVEAFVVPGTPPRFARRVAPTHTIGLIIADQTTGGRLGFVPACGGVDDFLAARLAATNVVLFDGTFWSDDELVRLGIGPHYARDMGHLPISEPGGSLAWLAQLNGRVVYTHINNTNPVLLECSPERETVEQHGVTIGRDGMVFDL